MAWTVEFTPAAERELGKLDRQAAVRIVQYLQDTVSSCNALAREVRASGQA